MLLPPGSPLPSRVLFCTPSQLWTLLLSRYRLRPSDFDPGNISDVTHTGAGLGSIRVADLPYDSYVAELRVLRSGDTVPKVGPVSHSGTGTGHFEIVGAPKDTYQFRIEIMATGFFRYSLNNGVSYSPTIPIPASSPPGFPVPGTGLTLCFIPGMSGFVSGDFYTFQTVGPAQVSATVFNVSTPNEPEGTGTITPSGQVPSGKSYIISVCVTSGGTIGAAKFIYSVNGGKPVGPLIVGASYAIPCLGVTLTFDPGCGPTYFGCGAQWIISTRGSFTFDVGAAPILLQRPEQTGLRLVFEPQSAVSPNYVAGDLYTFSTTAPPDMMEELRAASDEAMAKLRARYMGQIILAWDRSVTINAGRIALGTLYDRKGQNWQEDRKSIEAKSLAAHAFFTRVGSKAEHPFILAAPLPGVQAPRVILGPDDSHISDGPFSEVDQFGRVLSPFGRGVITNFEF